MYCMQAAVCSALHRTDHQRISPQSGKAKHCEDHGVSRGSALVVEVHHRHALGWAHEVAGHQRALHSAKYHLRVQAAD